MTMRNRHWAVVDRSTGETQFVQVPRGQWPWAQYGLDGYDFALLHREPTERDRVAFDGARGRLRECGDTAAAQAREAMLSHMTRSQLVDHILALINERKTD